MFSLTENQIAFIERDIAVRGITSSNLRIDLLDHICCLIENELDEYRNFEAVYAETITLFGDKGLKEIQLETNRLLTFKHYYIMNATMKISGYISSVMVLLGGLFKTMHWPGAGPLLVFGAFFFTLLFLPLMFILRYKSEPDNNRNVSLSIVGAIALMFIFAGLLFKLMHWPGAMVLAIAGCGLLLFFYLPIYIATVYKKTTNKINATSTIVILIAGVGFFLITARGEVSKNLIEGFSRVNNYTNQSLAFMEIQNQKIYQRLILNKAIDSVTQVKLRLLRRETESLDTYIRKLKTYLIVNVEQISEAEAGRVKLEDLNTANNYGATSFFLLDEENINTDYNAYVLKRNIEKYKTEIAKLLPDISITVMDTGEVTYEEEKQTWEVNNFRGQPLALVIYKLTQMELNLKTTESIALNQLQ